ncbi:hypothetical protein ACWQXT_24540 [Citrobacter werkmanii]
MFHVDNSTGVPVMPQPSPVTSETELFFTEGGNGMPPTYPGPDWFNIIQSELINILRAAGISPDKAKNSQIMTALKALFLLKSDATTAFDGKQPKDQTLTDLSGKDVAGLLQYLGLEHFGYEPSTGETAIFNGNKNLRYFINNNNESGVASVDFGLLWGFDGAGKLVKGIIPVGRLDGLSGNTGSSTTAVMHQKAVTDAINAAKTTVVQSVGTSTTSVMSQNAVTSLVNDAASVGVNQLWNDVTSSRTVGINYTNTTGRPIMIAMNIKNVPAGLFASSITVQGIELSAGSTVSGEHRFISAIVPPGQVYRYQPLASSNFILLELR